MISPFDGPDEQLSDDGRWRWDGERATFIGGYRIDTY